MMLIVTHVFKPLNLGTLYNDKFHRYKLRLAAMKKANKLSDTDLCVMCGMCLPQCPTYQLYQTETESPRGRVALMQAINQQKININSKALLHIDHCLGCLNCETICPSRVPYGQLIDEFRNQYNQSVRKPWLTKLILKQAAKPDGLHALTSIINKPVLKQLIKLGSTFTDLPKNTLTVEPTHLKSFYAGTYNSQEECRGEVSLFTGCIGKSSDYRSIKDATFILNQLGFDVNIPEQQTCCGAMHQHNGQLETAKTLLNKNRAQLEQQKSSVILFFSPACGASLKQAENIAIKDARTFILEALRHQPLNFSTQKQPVALHESCSHRNMLRLKTLNTELLNCIPGIQIIESSDPSLCCGAGGLQSINYPQQAQALLQGKLKSFDLMQTNIFISDNIGCSLHIKTAITGYNPDIKVMHPISYLASQLISNEKK
ncbi:MAG: hypothetical protein DIZ80_12355 [endosymbiont of Galathealinum brachiosum]|uniref:Glycolate oxidase iron-sulfur subunit n=1 Tax=endosymbiont of Galathealinum brachiosum TaxID=2200906 RepID=A0A370DFW5_9GAMM|nr:MAG: hypothetical protein DIZ80_12355 [endosymbiont of Galathealinum brachiosum]